MFPEFKNLKELMTRFSDDTVCLKYLEHLRWNGNPTCPHCNASHPYRLKDQKTYRCSAKTCRKDFTVLKGLIFENSKIGLSTWFAAIYIVTAHKKGISSCQLARDLSVTQKTAWFMNHRIREMFGMEIEQNSNETWEVDETYVGGRWENMNSKKKKRYTESGVDNKVPVMGLVQRDGSVILKVKDQNQEFKDYVNKHIHPNYVVVTDGHLSYRGIDQTHKGHIIVNHSMGEYVNGMYHTNTIEGMFSQLKRGIIGIYHHVSPDHLHRYCEEFAYRYNSRKIKDNERFVLTLKNSDGRLKYYELIGKPKPTKKSAYNG
jgi:transposase-like protein